jgi:hypothetical protein
MHYLPHLLRIVAACQLFISTLNFFLPRLLDWGPAIRAMPLLVREVFQVHAFFISVTCAIFGVLTWRFADDIADPPHEMLRWFAVCVGSFWAIRSMMQWTHYSPTHWRGLADKTLAHALLFCGYLGFAATYFLAAFRK